MSEEGKAGAAPAVAVHRDPAALFALLGGGVLLVEALLADLLFGFGDPSDSPLRTVLLLITGALLAAGAVLLLRAAPRLASLLCLLAASLAGIAQLPFFFERLHRFYEVSFSRAYDLTLGQAYAPLLSWLVAAAPLVCAAVLAVRQASRSTKTSQGEPGR